MATTYETIEKAWNDIEGSWAMTAEGDSLVTIAQPLVAKAKVSTRMIKLARFHKGPFPRMLCCQILARIQESAQGNCRGRKQIRGGFSTESKPGRNRPVRWPGLHR